MIARIPPPNNHHPPIFDVTQLKTESDVEQKLLYPFLTHQSYLALLRNGSAPRST